MGMHKSLCCGWTVCWCHLLPNLCITSVKNIKSDGSPSNEILIIFWRTSISLWKHGCSSLIHGWFFFYITWWSLKNQAITLIFFHLSSNQIYHIWYHFTLKSIKGETLKWKHMYILITLTCDLHKKRKKIRLFHKNETRLMSIIKCSVGKVDWVPLWNSFLRDSPLHLRTSSISACYYFNKWKPILAAET